MESAKTKQSASVVDMRKKADERGADKEEENYFKDRFVHFHFPQLLPILYWWAQWNLGFHSLL